MLLCHEQNSSKAEGKCSTTLAIVSQPGVGVAVAANFGGSFEPGTVDVCVCGGERACVACGVQILLSGVLVAAVTTGMRYT
jgi:hypothetical protein